MDFDSVTNIQAKMKEAQHKRATAYHDIFVKSESGRKILEEWVNSYCMGGVPNYSASIREVAMRDGKQELIKTIIDQLNVASGDSNE